MADSAEILLEELGLGTAPKVPVYVRDLTADDLISASQKPEYGAKPALGLIKKLRFPHHSLARLIAEGKKHPECAAITGYSIGTIVAYEKDPSFKELVAYYKEQAGQQYLDVHSRLATVGTMALEILHERLEEEPDKFTAGQLREIINDTFDRSVAPSKAANNGGGGPAGPQAPSVVNIHFGAPVPAPAIPHADTRGEAGKGSACLTRAAPALLELTVNSKDGE